MSTIAERISHRIYGEGPKIVLLHGLMGSAANWMKVANKLQQSFQVLVLDQRGHGESWQPSDGYRPEDFAAELCELLDHLGWKKIHLLGHSMGGRNSFVFASMYPDRVNKLIVEDIGPDTNQMNVDRIHSMFEQIPVPFVDRKVAREFFYEKFADGPGQMFDSPETMAKFLYSNLRKDAEERWDWRFSKPGMLAALREGRSVEKWQEWAQVKCPILLLRGEHSVELPRDIYLKMLEKQPNATGIEFKNGGHWLHFEQPELFIKTIVEFLQN